MIRERTIINAIIIIVSCILMRFVIGSTLSLDYGPALFFGGMFSLAFAFFILRDRLSICPFLGTYISGALNFLPIPLNAMYVACILLILYYFTGYVLLQQKKIKLGRPMLWVPIMVVTLIVFYHDHTLGVRMLGGKTEGGRPAVLIFIAVIAYFCAINVKTPSVNLLKWIPAIAAALTILSAVPFFLTTYFPSLAPYLYVFTDSVNVGAYFDTQPTEAGQAAGSHDDAAVGRFGNLGQVGISTQLCLLCYYPIGTWWRPSRWWVALLSVVCVICVALSGFRSVFFDYFCVVMIASWCVYAWRSVIIPVALAVSLGLLVVASANKVIPLPLDKLPLIAQRTLSFLPGDWAPEAVVSAESSNDFRLNIQKIYIKEYMAQSPFFGNGFDFNRDEFEQLNIALLTGATSDPGYLQAKLFIVGKMFHTGWVSVYDIVGIVGSLAFIALGWNEIWLAGSFVFGKRASRRSPLFPLYVWMTSSICASVFSYFAVFGDFGQAFPLLCIYAMILSQLLDLESSRETAVILPPGGQRPAEYTTLKGAGAYAGYNRRTMS